MTNNLPKQTALKTLIKYKRYSLDNPADLKHIIEANQFTIIEYKKYVNSDFVSALIKRLGIEREIEQNDSFLYINSTLKLLFIYANISDDDKCSLLRHELGHILDPDFINSKINYSKTKKEEFANSFSFYLRNPGIGFKFKLFIIKKWKLLISILLFIVCVSGFFVMNNPISEKQSETVTSDITSSESSEDIYYVTSSGKKYHKKYCTIIKYRNNLTELTMNEAIASGYKPCLVCHPDEE